MSETADNKHRIKHCRPLRWSAAHAREEHLGAVVIVVVAWLLGVAMLWPHLSLAESTSDTLGISWVHGCAAFSILIGALSTQKLLGRTQNLLRQTEELERDGIPVTGQIVDRWQSETDPDQRTFVCYRFDYLDTIWLAEQPVGTSIHADLQVGDIVSIRLLPRNPRICAIAPAVQRAAANYRKLVAARSRRGYRQRPAVNVAQASANYR